MLASGSIFDCIVCNTSKDQAAAGNVQDAESHHASEAAGTSSLRLMCAFHRACPRLTDCHRVTCLSGVGIVFLKTKSGDMYVKGVRPGGSAARSGVVSLGDRLYSIGVIRKLHVMLFCEALLPQCAHVGTCN